jgi:excisionase family DNA binding protein
MRDTFLNVEQVAEKLGVSERTIRRLIASRHLKVFRVGQRSWRIDQADLHAYIEEQKRRTAVS